MGHFVCLVISALLSLNGVSGARTLLSVANQKLQNVGSHEQELDEGLTYDSQLNGGTTTTTTTIEVPESAKAVIVCLLIMIVPAVVALTLGITQIIPYRSPYVDGSTKPQYSLYQRCFLAGRSIVFADNAELAVRGAIFGVIAAAPFYIPDMFFLVDAGRYTSFAVVMFVFTLYKTVGDTLNFAYLGMIGTCLAALNVWIMNGFYPGGVTGEDSEMFWPGVIDTVGFAVAILAFNFDLGTRVFALSWHTYFMMSFLDPNVTSGWSVGFEVKTRGPAISAVLQSGVGCGLAIVAVLLPFPIFALDKARTMSVKLTVNVAEAYSTCVECYCADSKKPVVEDKVRHCIKELQATVLLLGGYLASSWWECLGMGKSENVRQFLEKLDHSIRECYDRMIAVNHILNNEDYGEKHVKIMGAMRPSLKVLVAEAGKMLVMVTESSLDAHLDEAEMAKLDEQKGKTIAAVEEVTDQYKNHVNGKGALDLEVTDEAAFCMACCSFARIGIDFVDTFKGISAEEHEIGMSAEDMKKKATANLSNLAASGKKLELPDIFSVFKVPIHDRVYRNAVLRNTLSYLLAFYVGYTGYSLIIKSYNSGPATTVSLLISSGLGSAVVKNLNRLQGVVLGTFFGQLAYALLAWCSISGYIYVAVFVFFWLITTLFTYYHAVDFSGVACLLAAFGAAGVLRGCSNDPYDPGNVTHMISNTVLGVTFMTLVDQIFTLKAPSLYAKEALVTAWESYSGAMHSLFNKDHPNVRKHAGGVFAKIDAAAGASALANSEPRIWKTPFKHGLFMDVVQHCHELRCSLSCMECTSAASGKDDTPKADFLMKMYELKSFMVTKGDFEDYVEKIEKTLDIFEHETDQSFHEAAGIKPSEGKSPSDIAMENMGAMCRELDAFAVEQSKLGQKDIKEQGSKYRNLEDDVTCKIGMVIFSLNWQFKVLYSLKHAILSD